MLLQIALSSTVQAFGGWSLVWNLMIFWGGKGFCGEDHGCEHRFCHNVLKILPSV